MHWREVHSNGRVRVFLKRTIDEQAGDVLSEGSMCTSDQ